MVLSHIPGVLRVQSAAASVENDTAKRADIVMLKVMAYPNAVEAYRTDQINSIVSVGMGPIPGLFPTGGMESGGFPYERGGPARRRGRADDEVGPGTGSPLGGRSINALECADR